MKHKTAIGIFLILGAPQFTWHGKQKRLHSAKATGLAHSLVGFGYLYARQGQTKEALAALDESIEWFRLLEDQASLQFVSEGILQLNNTNEFEQPPPHMSWVKTYVTLSEGKVFCEFESPMARAGGANLKS